MSTESDWKGVTDQSAVDGLLRVARGFDACVIASAVWGGAGFAQRAVSKGLRRYGPLILDINSQVDDVPPLELSFQEVESFGYNFDLELGPSVLLEPSGIIARIMEWEVRAGSMAYRVVSPGETIDSLDAVREELAKWSGAAATLWTYGVTHAVLTIRLRRPNMKENLRLDCIGVENLSGPTGGSGVNFVIEETTRPRGRGAGRIPILHLKDIGKLGISVYCSDILLTRNVPPVY